MTEHYFITSTAKSIRKRKTNKGFSYDVIFRVIDDKNGREWQKTLTFNSPSAAKKGHAEFITKYCTLIDKISPVQQTCGITFRKAYSEYFIYSQYLVKESSRVSIRSKFNDVILPFFGDKPLRDLKKQDFNEWDKYILKYVSPHTKKLYSNATIEQTCAFLKAFLTWANDKYDIPNIYRGRKIPKRIETQIKPNTNQKLFWTVEEFNTFIAVVDDICYRAYFYTLFWCGCRKAEAVAFSEADYNGKELHIYKTLTTKTLDGSPYKITLTKANRDYTVPLAKPLRLVLDEFLLYKRKENLPPNYLFGGDCPLSLSSIEKKFKHFIKLSGVKTITPHDLRHSFVSMLIHHGASYIAIANMIGDTPEEVVRTYGHMYEDDKTKLIESFCDINVVY